VKVCQITNGHHSEKQHKAEKHINPKSKSSPISKPDSVCTLDLSVNVTSGIAALQNSTQTSYENTCAHKILSKSYCIYIILSEGKKCIVQTSEKSRCMKINKNAIYLTKKMQNTY